MTRHRTISDNETGGMMPKALMAYGDFGNHNKHWNWCPDEPVSVSGFVCANACSCGCNRAFTGVDSAKSTTLAKVIDVTDQQLQNIKARLYNCTLLGWNNNRRIANGALNNFDALCAEVDHYDVDTVLRVAKTDESFTLLPDLVEAS